MNDNTHGIFKTPAASSIQSRRINGVTSSVNSLKTGGKDNFADVLEGLAAQQKKGTTTQVYINEKGERILKITSDRGVQYRKIGDVDDVIWTIPVV